MGKINDLKNQALDTLRGKWGSFVGLTFVFALIYFLASSLSQFGTIFKDSSFSTLAVVFTAIGTIVTILFIPMQYGYYIAHLNSSRQDLPADIGDLFCGYRRFTDVFFTLLLQGLVVVCAMLPFIIFFSVMMAKDLFFTHTFLYAAIACLLMTPGMVLSLAYAMVAFILHDHPELHPAAVLTESRMMMRGHKWEFFLLMLSFFGWGILCVFTFGIGFLWLAPYIMMTEVKFYEQLRAEYEGAGEENEAAMTNEPVVTNEAVVEEKPAEVVE